MTKHPHDNYFQDWAHIHSANRPCDWSVFLCSQARSFPYCCTRLTHKLLESSYFNPEGRNGMFLAKLFYTPTELLGEIFQKTAVETFINFLPKLLLGMLTGLWNVSDRIKPSD